MIDVNLIKIGDQQTLFCLVLTTLFSHYLVLPIIKYFTHFASSFNYQFTIRYVTSPRR